MTTPDWPERKYRILYVSSSTPEDEGNKFFHERYVLELERRYRIAVDALNNPPKHRFWGAGEPDCPADIKAPNGNLRTLRCKDCGDWGRDYFCFEQTIAQCPPLPEEKERE